MHDVGDTRGAGKLVTANKPRMIGDRIAGLALLGEVKRINLRQ
jgi:hypothetical protein